MEARYAFIFQTGVRGNFTIDVQLISSISIVQSTRFHKRFPQFGREGVLGMSERVSLIEMGMFVASIALIWLNASGCGHAQPDCRQEQLMEIGEVAVWRIADASIVWFQSGMTVDADGAPTAYHADNSKALDYLGNAGRPGNWWALVTDTGKPDGTPIVQTDADPAPGYYVSMTALFDKSKKKNDPARYVDSTAIPYIALPARFLRDQGPAYGKIARIGDLAMVVNLKNETQCGAIFADIGPNNHLGEGSISLAESLGIPASPKKGGARDRMVYVLFSFSGAGNGIIQTKEEIQTRSTELFNAWGGMERLKQCLEP